MLSRKPLDTDQLRNNLEMIVFIIRYMLIQAYILRKRKKNNLYSGFTIK